MTAVLLLCVRAASPEGADLPRRHHFYVRTADVIGDESRRGRLSTACHYRIIRRNLLQLYVNYKLQKNRDSFCTDPVISTLLNSMSNTVGLYILPIASVTNAIGSGL